MRLLLIPILVLFCLESIAQNKTDRATIEDALVQYKTLDKNPQLLLLESILEKSKASFEEADTTLNKIHGELASWYLDERNFEKALDYLQLQEKALRQTSDFTAIAANLTKQGNCNIRRHDAAAARLNFEESIKLTQSQSRTNDFENYIGLCKLLYGEGNYDLLVEYAKHALSLATNPSQDCSAYYQIFRGNIALRNHDECERIIDKQLEISSKEKLKFERGVAYYCLAWLRNREKQHQESIYYYDKAISYFMRSDNKTKHERIAYCYSGMGKMYNKLEKDELAIQYAKLAVEESNAFFQNDFHPSTALHYHNVAVRYFESKDFESAQRQLQNAIKCYFDNPAYSDVRAVIPREDLYKVKIKWHLLRSLKDKALSYAHLYLQHENIEDAINAEKHMANVIELIEVMRSELSTEDTKILWRVRTRRYYNDGVEISRWLGDEEKMLKYMEKSRSLLLRDELNHKDALEMIPASLAQREKKLREIFTNEKSDDVTKYADYNNFLDSLKLAYPHYYEYKFQNNTPTIAEVQNKILSDSSQVVQYHMIRDSIFIHCISKNSTELVSLKRPKDLEEKVERLLTLVSSKDSLEYSSNYREFVGLSQELHTLLFSGIEDKKKNMIILADGVLNYLPYDLLVSGLDENGGPDYLINHHVFSMAPSLAVLMKLRGKKRFNNLLVVSPEEFTSTGLAPMQQSEEEIASLERLSSTTSLRNEQATFSNFSSHSDDYDVIHFTSHSGLDSLNRPWIAFRDSLVHLQEIYKLSLNASLVTLSSCKSFDGKSYSGEGINSLARAFLFADAAAVVGSTWNLNEAAGLFVLEDFYKRVKNGASKAEALRGAKLNFIEEHPYKSPHYWAPLVLIGDPGSLEVSSNHSHLGWFLFIGFLGVLCVILKKLINN